MKYTARTDVGLKRENNEDNLYARIYDDENALFVVCDGLGGYSSGEVASKVAVNCIRDNFEANIEKLKQSNQDEIQDFLVSVIKIANEKMTHISFGKICGNDGKPFKTRDGGVMSLNNLYSLVYDECYKKLSDNVKEEDKEDTARIISVAAIKYADLLPNRTSDYVFDPVRFSDLNGKTGPYLLYNTVRINSIFSKIENFEYKKYSKINTDVEREIILHLLELPNVLKREVEDNLLNELCEYIFKLTNLYNSFYSDNYIISEEDASKKESWLVMSDVVLNTNKFILDILGMEIPKSM